MQGSKAVCKDVNSFSDTKNRFVLFSTTRPSIFRVLHYFAILSATHLTANWWLSTALKRMNLSATNEVHDSLNLQWHAGAGHSEQLQTAWWYKLPLFVKMCVSSQRLLTGFDGASLVFRKSSFSHRHPVHLIVLSGQNWCEVQWPFFTFARSLRVYPRW